MKSNKSEIDFLERPNELNYRQAAQIEQLKKESSELEDKISNLIQELRCRDGQYKELLNENERLERELKWSDGNLRDKMVQLNKHSNLVDDLMKVINILVNDKSEEDE